MLQSRQSTFCRPVDQKQNSVEMFHQRHPIIKQLMLAAASLILSNIVATNSQQLSNGQRQASDVVATDWSPNEDSWNYWWSYSGISGPAYWGLLNLDWHMCDKGRRQSPINIETNRLVYDPHLSPLQLDSNLISGVLYNDGHAIVFNVSTKRLKVVMNNSQLPTTTTVDGSQIETKPDAAIMTPSANRSRRDIFDTATDHSLIGVDFVDPAQNTRDLSQRVDLSISQSEALGAKESDHLSQIPSSPLEFTASATVARNDAGGSYETTNNNGEEESDDQEAVQAANKVQITGAGLSYGYRFEAIYFRFGLDNKQAGSEHLINSKWHSAEVQILAYNSMLYKSFHEASSRPNGLLAIAILVETLEEQQHQQQQQSKTTTEQTLASSRQLASGDSELEKLLKPLNEIKFRNQLAEVRDFNLSALLPERGQFVTYEGSLNVPGCHESVDWLILNRPLYITQSNLDLLRSISADEQKSDTASGTLIAGNLRPFQPINDRPIRTSIRPPNKQANNEQNAAACQRLWTRYDYKPTNM